MSIWWVAAPADGIRVSGRQPDTVASAERQPPNNQEEPPRAADGERHSQE